MKDQEDLILTQETGNQTQKTMNNNGNQKVIQFDNRYAQMHRKILNQDPKTYFIVSVNFIKEWKEYCLSEKYSTDSRKPIINDQIFAQGNLKPNLKYKTHFQILNNELYEDLQPFVNPENKNQRTVKWQHDRQTNQVKPHFIIQCNYTIINPITLRKIDCGYINVNKFQYKSLFLKDKTSLQTMIDEIIRVQNTDTKGHYLVLWYLNNLNSPSKVFEFIKEKLVGLPFQQYKILNIGKQLNDHALTLSEMTLTTQKLFFLLEEIDKNSKPIFEQNFDGYCRNCNIEKSLQVQCQCHQIRYCSEDCRKNHFRAHQPNCSYAEELQLNKEILMFQNDSSVKGQAGIQNLGNTCYMNSCLQCLSKTLPLTKYFFKGHFEKEINKKNPMGTKGKLAKNYAKFIRAIWCEKEILIDPSNLKDVVGKINPNFAGNAQQDAQQFFSFLIDGLHEDLNRVKNKLSIPIEEEFSKPESELAKLSWKSFLGRNQSIVTDLMTGQYCSSLKCPDCNLKSLKFETFNTVPLPIPMESMAKFFLIHQHQYKKNLKGYFKYKSLNPNEWLKNACESVNIKNYERYMLYVVTEKENIYKIGRDSMEEIVSKIENENKNLFLMELTDDQVKIPKNQILQLTINMMQPDNHDKQHLFFKFTMLFNRKTAGHYEISNRILKFIYNQCYGKRGRQIISSEEDEKYDIYETQMVKKKLFAVYLKYGKTVQYVSKKTEVKFSHEIQLDKKMLVADILTKENISVSQCEIQIRFKQQPELTSEFSFSKLKRYEDSGNLPTSSSSNQKIELSDCFDAFSEPQVLMSGNQWYCPNCKTPKRALKQINIYRAPRILIIQLKRFRQRGTKKQKITLNVDFPFELDLSKYVIDQKPIQAYNQEIQNGYMKIDDKIQQDIGVDLESKPFYELYGVINHMGELGGGHYTAYAKSGGIWVEYNDSQFSHTQDKNVRTKNAFLLFYHRKLSS